MIIGIAGLKRSGKDTAALALLDKGFIKLSFAQPLKEVCAYATGLDIRFFDTDELKEKPFNKTLKLSQHQVNKMYNRLSYLGKVRLLPSTELLGQICTTGFDTPRSLLQFVGTEVVRDTISSTFWLDLLESKLEVLKDVVVTDCRFPNEVALIEKHKGKTIKVKRGDSGSISAHKTENSLNNVNFNFTIENNGSILDLHTKVLNIVA